MTIFDALLLGALQGATEFLPVSSDGHLVVAEHLLGLGGHEGQMAFNLLIHMATLIAIVIAYHEDLLNVLTAALGGKTHVKSPKFGTQMRDIFYTVPEGRAIVGWIAAATIVTGVLYLLTDDLIDPIATDPTWAGIGFLITSAVLAGGQLLAKGERNIRALGLPTALLMGFGQYLAILPGVSRSGLTISSGLMTGVGRLEAAKFSFLMAVPIITLAFCKEAYEYRDSFDFATDGASYAVGFTTALGVGVWAIGLLQRLLKTTHLWWFVIYTAVLGVVTLVFVR